MSIVTGDPAHGWWAVPPTPAGPGCAEKLALLVRTEVAWVRWAPLLREPADRRPWERHRALLHALADLGTSDGGDAAMRWGRDLLDPRSLDPCATEYGDLETLLQGVPEVAEWTTSADGRMRAIRIIADGLRACSIRDERAAQDQLLLNHFACRLHIPAVPVPGGISWAQLVDACVDLRFGAHGGGIWLYVTTSMWSSRPRSVTLAPQLESEGRPPLRTNGRAGTTMAQRDRVEFEPADVALGAFIDQVTAIVNRHFDPRNIRVARSDSSEHSPPQYRPPRFWVAACVRPADGMPHDRPCVLIDNVARRVLRVSDGVSSARLSRHAVMSSSPTAAPVPITVLRRLVSDSPDGVRRSSHDTIPHYLLLPLRTVPPEDQESAVRELIHRITDDEAHLAHQLFDLSTDLGIDDGLVRIYDEVANRANKLWDQLAMFLVPNARGWTDPAVHRLIGLLHVGLLQGIADLDELVRRAEENQNKPDTPTGPDSGDLDDRFVDVCGPGAQAGSLGRAVRETQHVADARRWAADVVARVGRTRDSYTSLHQAIANAFDERRVRDTDRVGKLALWVAGALALAGLVSEGWGRVLAALTQTASHRQPWFYFSLAVLVLITVLIAVYLRERPKRLDAVDFDERYGQLRGYLGACRTERLDELLDRFWPEPVAVKQPDPVARVQAEIVERERECHDHWDDEDRTLARRCAGIIDDVLIRPDGLVTDDLTSLERGLPALTDAVHRWLLAALFASERPRALWRYPMPRLLLLYRFFFDLDVYLPRPEGGRLPVVSDADLMLFLRTHHSVQGEDPRKVVEEWGRRLGRVATARDALRAIERTGIRPGLSREQMKHVINRMRTDLRLGDEACSCTDPTT